MAGKPEVPNLGSKDIDSSLKRMCFAAQKCQEVESGVEMHSTLRKGA